MNDRLQSNKYVITTLTEETCPIFVVLKNLKDYFWKANTGQTAGTQNWSIFTNCFTNYLKVEI